MTVSELVNGITNVMHGFSGYIVAGYECTCMKNASLKILKGEKSMNSDVIK
jgi:hypothetical protein